MAKVLGISAGYVNALLTRAAEGGDEEAISLLAAGALERRL